MADQVVVVTGSQAKPVDRRLRDRFNVDVGQLIVEINGRNVPGVEVLDESVSGMGLLMEDVSRIKAGTVLNLICDGTPLRGTVKSILARDDGWHRVGVEWNVDEKRSVEH
jgi:hypothetical protein